MLIRAILLGLKDWLLESPTLWSAVPSAVVGGITQSKQLGYERKPAYLHHRAVPTYYPLPIIRSWKQVPAKIERHDAKRAGLHLDFRLLIDGHVYDFAVVQTEKFPEKTGKVQRVQRTPTHSIKYFWTDKAVFGPGEYGEGTMKTAWRGDLDIIRSNSKVMEFSIPDGQFKGRYFMRNLKGTWVLGRMKSPAMPWKERMEYSATANKLIQAYDNPNVIAEHKLDGANYMLVPGEKENVVMSRRISVTGAVINQADKIPQLKYLKFPEKFWGRMIHVEVVAEGGSSSFTAGLLNSGSSNSRATQQAFRAPLVVHAWDIESSPGTSYGERRAEIRNLVLTSPKTDGRSFGSTIDRFWTKRFSNPRLIQMPISNLETGETPKIFAERMKAEGYEGVVLKDITKGYFEDVWVKDKKVLSVDVKVVGFQEGTGKHRGRLGALVVRDPQTRAESRVGTGFSDFEREWIWEHQDAVDGKLVMVDAHETTHNGILRGPRFMGLHPESGVVIQDEQALRDYAAGAGISPYQVKSAAGWRGAR